MWLRLLDIFADVARLATFQPLAPIRRRRVAAGSRAGETGAGANRPAPCKGSE